MILQDNQPVSAKLCCSASEARFKSIWGAWSHAVLQLKHVVLISSRCWQIQASAAQKEAETQDTVTTHEIEIQAEVEGNERGCQATAETSENTCQASVEVNDGETQAKPKVAEKEWNPLPRDLALFFKEEDSKKLMK